MIHWSDEIQIPYEPMLGCIGTAPAMGASNSMYAGPHGGNLDLVEVRPGSVVYLPVFVPGGLLSIGDAHAAMGHGELSASGLEMPARTKLRVQRIKSANLTSVRIETSDEIIAVATGCPMERSIAQAYAELILWMEREYQWDRWRAYDLLTHVGRISVGYYAFGTVGAKVAKRFLSRH
jgi:acetamidase/formamidase